ncbi:MAG: hypothetical protein CMO44_15020 [Verrucomicrobiales bacterium]|nr:hypothetical protein [Verrucomicrobiales bacterium]
MGNGSYKCYRYLHSRSQYQIVFDIQQQQMNEDEFQFKRRIMGLWKHEVYKMTLGEEAYADRDTRKLSICLGYRTLCSAVLDKKMLTIVFGNTEWQELWDGSPEAIMNKQYVYRWVAAVTDYTQVIVPFTYQWYVKKNIRLPNV